MMKSEASISSVRGRAPWVIGKLLQPAGSSAPKHSVSQPSLEQGAQHGTCCQQHRILQSSVLPQTLGHKIFVH